MSLLRKIFGNDEEPIPRDPQQWQKYQNKWGRFALLYWRLRNPAHNFTWHIIGVNKRGSWLRIGLDAKHSFALKGGWQRATIYYTGFTGNTWRLPYVSYINRVFRFRIGWGDAGNFTPLSIRGTRPDNITWGNNA